MIWMWIIVGMGLLLAIISLSAIRINEKEIKLLQKMIKKAKPWDPTDSLERQLDETGYATARAVVWLIASVLMILVPLLIWLLS